MPRHVSRPVLKTSLRRARSVLVVMALAGAVASISSCHFLTFVYLAGRAGFQVDAYEDDAVGTMTKNDRGIPWVSRVVLAPKVTYGGDKRPSPDEESRLHHDAHEQCFISNSVKTEIVVSQG